MLDLYDKLYKPDVLSCLADLSNDEVMTSPDIANKMLDLLPQEMFKNPETKILDPFCKSGVFLREAAKRFIKGEKNNFKSLQECIDWVFHNQLYGIAITELTSLLSRRSVYCSKYANSPYSITQFDAYNVQGNIVFHRMQHYWIDLGEKKQCKYCGVSAKELDRDTALETHAYEFIHIENPEEIFNMIFDVIIGNPPYQLETGGGSEKQVAATQAKPIYHQFVEQAKKLNPKYITMIIPARWYNGGIGLEDFRHSMLSEHHISHLVDYSNSKDCFTGVDIAGGICYFLWERDSVYPTCEVRNLIGKETNVAERSLDEFGDMFIRSNEAISIIKKITSKTDKFISSKALPIDAFGFPSKARGSSEKSDDSIKLIHSQGAGYVSRNEVKKNSDLIDKYKVIIGILVPCNGEVGIDPIKGYKSITTPRILDPGEIPTFSYLVINCFDTEDEAVNFQRYMLCKLPRFMMRVTYSSMHIARNNFMFVPDLDFNVAWTDEMLYDYFELNDSERDLINKTMRQMDLSGGDD